MNLVGYSLVKNWIRTTCLQFFVCMKITGSNDTEGFIHRSLKEVTCTDVEVTPLASFVSDLSTLSSQGTTARNSDFATKWDEYMKNVTLVYQMGTWVPKSFSEFQEF